MKSARFVLVSTLLAIAVLGTACGQKGDLYRPPPPAQEPAEDEPAR